VKYIPDVLTGSRILLAGLMGVQIVAHSWTLATFFLFLAILTDAFDGEIARSLKTETRYGDFFDQFADGLLWVFLFVSLTLAGELPWWALAILLLGSLVFQLTTMISKGSRWWLIRRHMHWIHPVTYALTLSAGLVWLTHLTVDQVSDGSSVFIMLCCIYAAGATLLVSEKRERIEVFLKGP